MVRIVELENELNVDRDAELVWGLKYYGRCLKKGDTSEFGVGSLMIRAAERIKELKGEDHGLSSSHK